MASTASVVADLEHFGGGHTLEPIGKFMGWGIAAKRFMQS